MAEPKCPQCGITGIEKIVSQDSAEQSKGGDAWFNVVHCEECGHVYGVFAKHILNHEVKFTPPLPNIPHFG
jgi:uncharacterized Zn finger protein